MHDVVVYLLECCAIDCTAAICGLRQINWNFDTNFREVENL
jgi:hypothetical protein